MRWPAERMQGQRTKGFGMFEAATAMAADGIDVIRLEFGRPSFDTPTHIKEATKQALDDGVVHYGDLAGDGELREALCEKLASFNELSFSADEVLITNGLTQASMAVFEAGVNPGDQVLMTDPFYPQHPAKVALVGGVTGTVPLVAAENFRIDAELLERAILPNTTMLCLINPANPVGRVFSRAELEIVAEAAIKHDLIVVTDEVYEYITFDDHRHISIASIDGMRERTISLFAFTKAYAMDGWRIGYAAGPRHLIDDLKRVTMNQSTHPNVFAQRGALAAVQGPHRVVTEMVAEDRRRRDLLCSRLDAMDGISCATPEGTIYAFPSIEGLGMSSDDVAMYLLNHAHVAVESGSFYGLQGEGHLRVCFGSASYERIDEALSRIETAIAEL